MCGIVGCVGKLDVRDYLMQGLRVLDYRGYDSAGVAFIENEKIEVFKSLGSVDILDKKTKKNILSNIGIGHTRWATHGVPNDINSHPHLSNSGQFVLVHNGVIENYKEIKVKLIEKGYSFISETDSEVIVNLIDYHYKKTKNVLETLEHASKILRGSYAISLLYKDEPNTLYFYKKQSPLMIGLCEKASLLASDATPMIKMTKRFIDLKDDQYGYLKAGEAYVFQNKKEIEPEVSTKDPELLIRDLKGYPHFMLKEIDEIDAVINRLIDLYARDGCYCFDPKLIEDLKNADDIVFIACGTSYHASLVGAKYFENIGKHAYVHVASEFGYYPKKNGENTVYVLLSQSGETADSIRCQKYLNEQHKKILVITNTRGSTLERNATYPLALDAGVEISVASTKVYSAMVTILVLLAGAVVNQPDAVKQLRDVARSIMTIKARKDEFKNVALKIKNATSLFYLGRGYDYITALEASLKLKETSYIHSEAFPGGEIKHGPIALITEKTPVIIFISDPITADAMRNNAKEIESRGAKVYIVSSENLKQEGDAIVVDDSSAYLSPLIKSVVAFYLAYFVSSAKGLDVDKPRNLAKAVTVE